VLRSAYDFPKNPVIAALRAFAGLPRVKLEAPHHAARAMDRADAGMDFADALHQASALACEAFITFDRRMAKASEQVGGIEVRVP
jgi:predicted nucleic acid-binding protein